MGHVNSCVEEEDKGYEGSSESDGESDGKNDGDCLNPPQVCTKASLLPLLSCIGLCHCFLLTAWKQVLKANIV